MIEKLTPAAVKAARQGDVIWCHEVTGLHLIAGAKAKGWFLKYTTRDGIQRRPKLGAFPAMSLKDARETAAELKRKVALGEDPVAKWRAAREAPTVADLCDRYIEEWLPKNKSGHSLAEDKRTINTHIKPGLGSVKLHMLNAKMINAWLENVLHRKYISAEVKARDGIKLAPVAANRARAALSHMLGMAKPTFEIDVPWPSIDPPTNGTTVYPERPRKRFIKADEMPRIAEALDTYAEGPALNTLANQTKQAAWYRARRNRQLRVACVWAILLSGARVKEIVNAQADQLEGDALLLDKHKTVDHIGDKVVYLPKFVLAMLDGAPSHGRLFGKIALRSMWRRIRTMAGVPDLTLRDARRTFASFARSRGMSLDQVGALLHHTKSNITDKRYAFIFDDVRRDNSARVADAILEAAKVKRPKPPAAQRPAALTLARIRRRRAS